MGSGSDKGASVLTTVNSTVPSEAVLTLGKDISRMLNSSWASIKNAVSRVVNMSAEERRLMQQRAVGVAACAAAAAYGAPQVSEHVTDQKEQEALLHKATEMAEAISAERRGEDMIAALDLSRPWRQQVSYETAEADGEFSVQPTVALQDVVDVLSGLGPRDLAAASQQRADHNCMAEAIYYEARSESLRGHLAVAEVVLNRVDSKFYPDSVCGVVYQGAERRTGCQFSFTCDGSTLRSPRGEAWRRANAVAANVLMKTVDKPITGGATHYHTNYVSPYWQVGLIRTNVIDTHIFYRFPETGREWARVQLAKAAYVATTAAEAELTEVSTSTEELMARELERLDREV